jgi:hypothetical protein
MMTTNFNAPAAVGVAAGGAAKSHAMTMIAATPPRERERFLLTMNSA